MGINPCKLIYCAGRPRVLLGPSLADFCSFFGVYGFQVRFFGAARLSRAPKNALCSAKARAECASHVLLRSCRRILGASIFKVHMYLLCRGWAGAGGLGAVLRSLVSPQRCTTTCFDVFLICTRLFGQETPPINDTLGGCPPLVRREKKKRRKETMRSRVS